MKWIIVCFIFVLLIAAAIPQKCHLTLVTDDWNRSEVMAEQTLLEYWGLLHAGVDGVYGLETARAQVIHISKRHRCKLPTGLSRIAYDDHIKNSLFFEKVNEPGFFKSE